MRKLRIVSVARPYPDCENTSFAGNLSLTDFDIVIIDPGHVGESFPRAERSAQNNLVILAPAAHGMLANVLHRQSEIQALLEAGKLVICFCTPLVRRLLVFQDREKQELTNYSWLPADLDAHLMESHVEGTGREITLVDRKNVFAPYYLALKESLTFRLYFRESAAAFKWGGVFLCNSIDQVVGFSRGVGNGIIAFLPEFGESDENKEKFIGVLRQIAKSHFGSLSASPPPGWIGEFVVPGVDRLEKESNEMQVQLAELEGQMDRLDQKREYLEGFRALLYEQGDILKDKVIDVFKLMGFAASTIVMKNTDLDVVLESGEGRAIVEVEGKNDAAINKDKIDQLVSGITQDYETARGFAKGVLVGNPFRLKDPRQRPQPFTDAVVDISAKFGYALMTTVDLYATACHMLTYPSDEAYKAACRNRVVHSVGVVVLAGESQPGA